MKGIKGLISKVVRHLAEKKRASAQGEQYSLDFSKIYRENLFDGDESISGQGSSIKQTQVLREELPRVLHELGVKTLLDIPCGDFNWMRHVDFGDIQYIGGDIVNKLVVSNESKFAKDGIRFACLDLTRSRLPVADAVFCRDCLVHLNFKQCSAAIENIRRSGAEFFLTTTFVNRDSNIELKNDIWRALNLCKAPFYFPKPLLYINENCTERDGRWNDKCIGVWKVKELPQMKIQ